MDGITLATNEMRLGAFVTLSQILDNADIARLYPALCEACREFAGPPIRNRGTVGGNVVNASPAADLPSIPIRRRSISTAGDKTLSRILRIRSVPPAITLASAPRCFLICEASSSAAGAVYSILFIRV